MYLLAVEKPAKISRRAQSRQGRKANKSVLITDWYFGDANSRNKFAVSGHDFSRAATSV